MPPLAASTPLAYQEDNPKPEDSAAYARYHKYKGAQTFEAFLQSGGTLRDLRKDKKNGYVAVDADMDGAEALVKKLTAPKSLVPRWRAMKRIQNDLAAFDTGVDPGGEYVQPKPSFMDPIGDVPRRAPLFHSTRRRRPPPAELLRHRALVRTALSTAGPRVADKICEGGQRRPRSVLARDARSSRRTVVCAPPPRAGRRRPARDGRSIMGPWRPAGAGLRAGQVRRVRPAGTVPGGGGLLAGAERGSRFCSHELINPKVARVRATAARAARGSVSSSVVTASRRSSSVAPGSS